MRGQSRPVAARPQVTAEANGSDDDQARRARALRAHGDGVPAHSPPHRRAAVQIFKRAGAREQRRQLERQTRFPDCAERRGASSESCAVLRSASMYSPASGCYEKEPQEAHQSGLPRAGAADNGHELTTIDAKRDVRDGTDYGRAGPIVLLQTRGENERLGTIRSQAEGRAGRLALAVPPSPRSADRRPVDSSRRHRRARLRRSLRE